MNIVLVAPEIPYNAGAAGRLALATGATLHLIKPLGFSLDEKAVRRAGLDYWKDVDLKVWESFDAFHRDNPETQLWFLSTKAKKTIWEAGFKKGDFLVFGRESKGLPEEWTQRANALRIPMVQDSTRSLNLATAIGIVLYEACRQAESLD
jgi:tRNA (cytidine/uridine-2'-O-)-methyltransferase